MTARVAWISIAPVKALALVHPDEVQLERFGVRGNRRFCVVEEDGRLVNGIRLGRLVQVAAEYDDAAETLALRFPDGTEIAGDVALGEPVETALYSGSVAGRLVLGPWAE